VTTIRLPEWPWEVVRGEARALDVEIWLVGGAVRDLLLARPRHDWDFAVDRRALALGRAVGDALSSAFFPLDQDRGTARVVLDSGTGGSVELDFSLLRGETLDADLVERDFTVNAMAVDEGGTLIDLLGGQADLRARRIRATSESAFRDDPVRLLRSVRLEAELGFETEPETESWIRRDAPLLARSAAERLRDEFVRGLRRSGAADFIRRLDDLELLIHVVPELDLLKGVTQTPPRPDVWHHTLNALGALEQVVATVVGEPLLARSNACGDIPPAAWETLARSLGHFAGELRLHLAVNVSSDRDRRLLLKLATLLHDVAKPQTHAAGEEGQVHFYGHESAGGRLAEARMRALRFSRDEATRVRTIIAAHLRPAQLARADTVTRRAIYRYFRDTGDAGVDTVLLSLADYLTAWGSWGPDQEERWLRRLEVAEVLLHHYFQRRQETVAPELPLDGHDLMRELDLEPGPKIGEILDALREAMAAGEIETREEALALAREIGGWHLPAEGSSSR
jgi:tRNA nucleotidyltransferase/poly(A) polymerase